VAEGLAPHRSDNARILVLANPRALAWTLTKSCAWDALTRRLGCNTMRPKLAIGVRWSPRRWFGTTGGYPRQMPGTVPKDIANVLGHGDPAARFQRSDKSEGYSPTNSAVHRGVRPRTQSARSNNVPTNHSESQNLAPQPEYCSGRGSVHRTGWRHGHVAVRRNVHRAIRWHVDGPVWRHVNCSIWWLIYRSVRRPINGTVWRLVHRSVRRSINGSVWRLVYGSWRRHVDLCG
jgi:hypothetical protein